MIIFWVITKPLKSNKFPIIGRSARPSGFNNIVINGIITAIPIISKIPCNIEKKTIKIKLFLSFWSKKFHMLNKSFTLKL